MHTRRDLRDTCLSCYEQFFTTGQTWSFTFDEIAHYARAYHHLMAHWRATIPEAFLDFDYETLASAPEVPVRMLLEYCTLDWHENCLSPHTADGMVQTASAAQVRESIHPRSIGRWRRYEKHLAHLLKALSPLLDEK